MNNMIDGLILVNKEKGWTSNDIVSKIKHLLHEKVGHTGTLDPNATGVLPLLIGKGTKLSKYLIEHDKKYIAKIKLGEKTTTADIEGEIIERKDVNKSIYENDNKIIIETLNSFLGKSSQIPPIYSALKVNGKKLYEYARENKEIDIKPREIEIYEIKLLEVDRVNNIISIMVHCSKGTYIRTLSEDISKKLGTVGYMQDLERIQVGKFKIEDSIKISDIEQKYKNSDNSYIINLESLLNQYLQIGSIDLNNDLIYNKYFNGVKIDLDRVVERKKYDDGIYIIKNKSRITGIGIVTENKLKRDIVF